jgi:probable F420-dependent oxidoreductase
MAGRKHRRPASFTSTGAFMPTIATRPFRFGLIGAVPPPGHTWSDQARQAESLGFATLQVPDTLGTLAAFPAMAAAAAVTSTLRVSSYVLATPHHRPAAVAHQALTLDVLSGGRFDLGLGLGRPDAQREAEQLGVEFGTPGERIEHLRATLAAVRGRFAEPVGPLQPVQSPHPPILIPALGPRMLRLAAAEADIVEVGVPVEASEDDLAAKAAELRDYAGDRSEHLELAFNLTVVGREETWMTRMLGADPARLLAIGAVRAVDGTPAEMADLLRRRRDRTGVSYIQVGAMVAEKFAPVVELLAGT